MKISKKFLLEATNTGDVISRTYNDEKTELDKLVDSSKININTIDGAILNNNPDMLKTLIKRGQKPTENSFEYALIKGNPEVIKLITIYNKNKTPEMLIKGINTKEFSTVDAIIQGGIKPDPQKRTLDYGIRTNSNNIVKSLLKAGDKPSYLSLFLAISMGNPDIVKTIINDARVIPTNDNLIQAKKQKTPNQDIINYITNALY